MRRFSNWILAGFFLAGAAGVAAQEPQPPAPQPPEAQNESAAYDPYHAEKSIEIGRFYMKKGNYDAAIERFEKAVQLKPGYAKPYLLLGEAYEKKGDKNEALKAYQKYLELYPSSPDRDKIQKKIEGLTRALAREKRRRRSH